MYFTRFPWPDQDAVRLRSEFAVAVICSLSRVGLRSNKLQMYLETEISQAILRESGNMGEIKSILTAIQFFSSTVMAQEFTSQKPDFGQA